MLRKYYRPQDWGQSVCARGGIDNRVSPHSVDFVATSPLKGRGIVYANQRLYLGAHFVRPEVTLQQAGFAPLRRTLLEGGVRS